MNTMYSAAVKRTSKVLRDSKNPETNIIYGSKGPTLEIPTIDLNTKINDATGPMLLSTLQDYPINEMTIGRNKENTIHTQSFCYPNISKDSTWQLKKLTSDLF